MTRGEAEILVRHIERTVPFDIRCYPYSANGQHNWTVIVKGEEGAWPEHRIFGFYSRAEWDAFHAGGIPSTWRFDPDDDDQMADLRRRIVDTNPKRVRAVRARARQIVREELGL